MKFAFFGVRRWEKEAIEKESINLPTFGVGIFEGDADKNLDLVNKYEAISIYEGKVLEKCMKSLGKVKVIAIRNGEVGGDLKKELKRKKIELIEAGKFEPRVAAEYCLSLLLNLTKRIEVASETVEEEERPLEDLLGVDIRGKTLGVVGVGGVGSNLIEIAKGLGLRIIGVDRVVDEVLAKRLGFSYTSLEGCLGLADFVCIHVGGNKENRHLINKKNIKLMKKGSFLVSMARGDAVEIEAVVWALNAGWLRGAAFDIGEREFKRSGKFEDGEVGDDYRKLMYRDDTVLTVEGGLRTKDEVERKIKNLIGEMALIEKRGKCSKIKA